LLCQEVFGIYFSDFGILFLTLHVLSRPVFQMQKTIRSVFGREKKDKKALFCKKERRKAKNFLFTLAFFQKRCYNIEW
ncbi:MAG: hypothetical protein IIY01_03190, partial [Clostridia bacterium]|nr:hypothetical protein [Clostridia bacterium]